MRVYPSDPLPDKAKAFIIGDRIERIMRGMYPETRKRYKRSWVRRGGIFSRGEQIAMAGPNGGSLG